MVLAVTLPSLLAHSLDIPVARLTISCTYHIRFRSLTQKVHHQLPREQRTERISIHIANDDVDTR